MLSKAVGVDEVGQAESREGEERGPGKGNGSPTPLSKLLPSLRLLNS